jgi:NTE family protein
LSGNGSPDRPTPRCVVLGAGGLTAIAWLHGALDALPPLLDGADRVIGSSAGALLAARLLGGGTPEGLSGHLNELAGVRLGAPVVARLLAAQVWPSRRHALIWLGRAARKPVTLSEEAFVDLIGRVVGIDAWPASLVVVAVDAESGRPAYFTARSGVELHRAVAASCAMPAVFPPVTIEDRTFLDGGLRSPANADLASGCGRVVVLAPSGASARVVRRPGHQADRLRAEGAEVVLVEGPRPRLNAMAAEALPAARERGRAQGGQAAAAVRDLWGG